MRAFEIILFLVCIQAAVGFVNTVALFDNQYYATPSNRFSENYTISEISQYGDIADEPGILDYFEMTVMWLWTSFFIFLNIVFGIAILYFPLVNLFGMPQSLALFIQAGVAIIYVWGYIQFKSGRSTKHMT